MTEKIVNIYSFESEPGVKSYIYSMKRQEDYLGYDYYILTKNESNETIIYEANNTINILQTNGINLTKIEKNNPEYKQFLSELLTAINTQNKKREVPVRSN